MNDEKDLNLYLRAGQLLSILMLNGVDARPIMDDDNNYTLQMEITHEGNTITVEVVGGRGHASDTS